MSHLLEVTRDVPSEVKGKVQPP